MSLEQHHEAATWTGTLNWANHVHWSSTQHACTHCGSPTHLLDDQGQPAHKVCVEHLIDTGVLTTPAAEPPNPPKGRNNQQ